MTPVRSVKNQYQGINAHLHSYLQTERGWDEFHTSHIVHLTNLLKIQLLPMGYTAGIEQSLQIRRLGEPAGKPKSDVTIFDTLPARPPKRLSRSGSVEGLAISAVMNIDESLTEYRAIAVYEYVRGQAERGDPVAWIELLSPSNKPGGQDADYYREKRLKLLHSGIVFVELDYLHESPPTFEYIPSYSRQVQHFQPGTDAHPYHIVVIDPRPSLMVGKVYPYGFDVDADIPNVVIPLNSDDTLLFDFGSAYHKTYTEGVYGLEWVDYSQLPLQFERYSRADQMRILARMLAVLKASRDGLDLEQGALFATDKPDFDKALGQIRAWK
jgi:hypothetical protein